MSTKTKPQTQTDSTAVEGSDTAIDTKPVEIHPTVKEAKAMFEENPGLAAVLTDQGFLHRDGSITAQ